MEANSIVCVAGSLILHHQSWSPVVATRFTLITFWFRLKAIRTRPTSIPTIAIFIFIIIIIMTLITFWFRWKVIRTRAPHFCDHITFLFRGSEVLFLLLPKMADLGYQKMGLLAPEIKKRRPLTFKLTMNARMCFQGCQGCQGCQSCQRCQKCPDPICGRNSKTELWCRCWNRKENIVSSRRMEL